MRLGPRLAAAAAAGVLLLTLAACGDDSSADTGSDSSGSSESEGIDDMDDMADPDDMADMEMSEMNEPDAMPADEVDGDVVSGEFVVLDTAPPGSDGVSGEAWQAQNDDGTTVTIRMSGLVPGTEYVSHLHEQACETDDGGDHFKFDPTGSDDPPNEVHLGLTADDDGNGEATVTNDQQTGDGAPAIVVHPAESTDNRLACADFS